MEFTIPNLIDEKKQLNQSVQAGTRDAEATNETDDTIPFHRHCQKTVLSAHGHDENGTPWKTIKELQLANLPPRWIDKFSENVNITDDLAENSSVVNEVAGNKGSFTLNFKDATGNPIQTETINLNTTNTSRDINLGRRVNLGFGTNGSAGQFSFHTTGETDFGGETDVTNIALKKLAVQVGGEEVGSAYTVLDQGTTINIPTRTIKIMKNGEEKGTFSAVGSGSEQTIDLSHYHDYNLLPAKETTIEMKPDGSARLYETSSDQSITISINNENYIGRICEFELSVYNSSDTDFEITFNQPNGYSLFNLTDDLTVKGKHANIYAFRVDGRRQQRMIYSLAYTLNIG